VTFRFSFGDVHQRTPRKDGDFLTFEEIEMAKRKYDLAVKVGQYTDQAGATKNRYQNIGVVMQGDDGGFYALLDPMVNLAAVPRDPGKDRVMVSMFEPRDDAQQPRQAGGYQTAAVQQRPAARPAPAPMDEPDVPF